MTFHDSKQHLGLEEPQEWSEQARSLGRDMAYNACQRDDRTCDNLPQRVVGDWCGSGPTVAEGHYISLDTLYHEAAGPEANTTQQHTIKVAAAGEGNRLHGQEICLSHKVDATWSR